MNTKLTLSIDDAVVKRAKEYSKKAGRSLLKLIKNYLLSLTTKNTEKTGDEMPPFLKNGMEHLGIMNIETVKKWCRRR